MVSSVALYVAYMPQGSSIQSWTRLKRLSMHAYIGEGNGNPLQYSCLENPRDGGAWWAAVYGVAESDMTEATWQQPLQKTTFKEAEAVSDSGR